MDGGVRAQLVDRAVVRRERRVRGLWNACNVIHCVMHAMKINLGDCFCLLVDLLIVSFTLL